MRRLWKLIAALGVISISLIGGNARVSAANFSLFSTGVDNSGNVLPLGAYDFHYFNPSYGDFAHTINPGILPYVDDPGLPPSTLVSFGSYRGSGEIVTDRYQVKFNLTGFDPSTALITGRLAALNEARILFNGVDIGIHFGTTATLFSITSGFLAGENELLFVGTNYAVGSDIRAQLLGTADLESVVGTTPIPAALPLFASGLGALGLMTWRRKRKAVAA